MLELLTVLALTAPGATARLRPYAAMVCTAPALANARHQRDAAPCRLSKAQRRSAGASQRQDRPQAVTAGVRPTGQGCVTAAAIPELALRARGCGCSPSRPRDPPSAAPA